MKYLGWFSCGVTYAVACKLAIEKFGDDVELWYIETGAAHLDNIRFIKDCEKWYGRKIQTARSEKYASPLDVASKQIFNTPYGAPCTYELKKKVRQKIQNAYTNFTHVFGFEYTPKEINRAKRWSEQNTKIVVFPLIENKLPYLPIDIIPMHSLALKEFKPNNDAQSSLIAFDKDDILIGAMRVYFHRVIIAPCAGITRSTCFVLSPTDKNYLVYGLLLCNQKESIEFAQTTSKGSTMPYAVWEGGLGELEIIIPSSEVVVNFNNLLLPSIKKIPKSYFENTRLAALRDTLLPKLMKGEIDVDKVDVSVA